MRKYLLVSLLMVSVISACRKKADPVTTPSGNGSLRVTIQNVVGKKTLALGVSWYENENGDSFRVSMYKYYISNIVFVKDDGTEVRETESYHLIDQADDVSKSFVVGDVPPGNYTKIKFLIGVDVQRNTSGAQTGALDPMYGMFWDWNTGYIMAKFEGNSPQSPISNGNLAFHSGGFTGMNSVLKNVELSFPSNAVVNSAKTPNIHMKADLLEWFKTPTLIKFKDFQGTSMAGPDARMVADNYADMFNVDHIE